MRVAIVGAGAVGCYYGGMLARAGAPGTLSGITGSSCPGARSRGAGARGQGACASDLLPHLSG